MKYFTCVAIALLATAAPLAARACSADVELVGSEAAGTDVLNSFRLLQKAGGTVTISFDATTAIRHGSRVYRSTSSYAESLSGTSRIATLPEIATQDVDEIVSVKISNVRCTP